MIQDEIYHIPSIPYTMYKGATTHLTIVILRSNVPFKFRFADSCLSKSLRGTTSPRRSTGRSSNDVNRIDTPAAAISNRCVIRCRSSDCVTFWRSWNQRCSPSDDGSWLTLTSQLSPEASFCRRGFSVGPDRKRVTFRPKLLRGTESKRPA